MRALGRAVETDLGELAGLAWRHWRLLAGLAVGAALAAFLISFLLTPRYHSVVSILPRQGFLREQQIVLGRGTLNNAVELRPTTASNSQNLVAAASFRTRAALVDSLGLVDFFGHAQLAQREPARARELAMDDLRRATHLELSIYRDVLFIHVMTRDPEMSARIANLTVQLLEAENLALYRAQARAMERYLEGELLRVRGELFAVADSLADYYRRHGLIEIASERKTLFSLLGELELQRSALALSLGREALDRAPDDPQLARLQSLLAVYDELVADLGKGKGVGAGSAAGIADTGTVLGAEELQRRLEQLQLGESALRTELAAAVMESAREEASLPVMDRAFPASEPYWPRRWLMALAAGVLAPGLVYLALLYRRVARALAATGQL